MNRRRKRDLPKELGNLINKYTRKCDYEVLKTYYVIKRCIDTLGLHRYYYTNENIWREEMFDKNNRKISMKVFHRNGRIKDEDNYKDRELDGPRRSWNEKGQLQRTMVSMKAICADAKLTFFSRTALSKSFPF